jgi:hypothetical protein
MGIRLGGGRKMNDLNRGFLQVILMVRFSGKLKEKKGGRKWNKQKIFGKKLAYVAPAIATLVSPKYSVTQKVYCGVRYQL